MGNIYASGIMASFKIIPDSIVVYLDLVTFKTMKEFV